MTEPPHVPEPRSRPWPAAIGHLLAEGTLIVFAVLVALAADAWWEEREDQALAERATIAITREIRRNLADLAPDPEAPPLDELMARIDEGIERYREGGRPRGFGVTWNVGLLSSAAWETAQITRATQHLPLDRLIDLAQMYEFQRFYSARQDDLVQLIATMEARLEREPVQALLELKSQYAMLSGLRTHLGGLYACRLVDLIGPDIDEAAACSED